MPDHIATREAEAWVSSVHRYPVKGLGGESLDVAEITPGGIAFDRWFALTHDRVALEPFGEWSSFEAFVALDGAPRLAGYRAEVTSTPSPVLSITSPADETIRLAVDATGAIEVPDPVASTISQWFSTPHESARLIGSGTALWDLDDAPISLINLATVRQLSAAAGESGIDQRRLRANVYLDGLQPWEELELVGSLVQIGDAVLEVLRPIERCRAITVNPEAPVRDVNLLGVLASVVGHGFCGVYARVVTPGRVEPGSSLRQLETLSDPTPSDLTERERAAMPRRARVVRTTPEGPDVLSVDLEDSTGHLGAARPGQHLRIHRSFTDRADWRDYTISRVGPLSRITVRRREGGRFSPWVHDLVSGGPLIISGPFGDPPPMSDGPLLVITAGIGITPALALAADDTAGPDHSFIHVARTALDVPLLDELRANVERNGARLQLISTSRDGRDALQRAVLAELDRNVPRSVVLCGPTGFESSMRALLTAHGVADDQIHTDPFFSPRGVVPEWRAPSTIGPHRVEFNTPDPVEESWRGEETVLDVADRAGVRIPSSCRAGVCGTCLVRVDGPTEYVLDPLAPERPGSIYACCAVPRGDVRVAVGAPTITEVG